MKSSVFEFLYELLDLINGNRGRYFSKTEGKYNWTHSSLALREWILWPEREFIAACLILRSKNFYLYVLRLQPCTCWIFVTTLSYRRTKVTLHFIYSCTAHVQQSWKIKLFFKEATRVAWKPFVNCSGAQNKIISLTERNSGTIRTSPMWS